MPRRANGGKQPGFPNLPRSLTANTVPDIVRLESRIDEPPVRLGLYAGALLSDPAAFKPFHAILQKYVSGFEPIAEPQAIILSQRTVATTQQIVKQAGRLYAKQLTAEINGIADRFGGTQDSGDFLLEQPSVIAHPSDPFSDQALVCLGMLPVRNNRNSPIISAQKALHTSLVKRLDTNTIRLSRSKREAILKPFTDPIMVPLGYTDQLYLDPEQGARADTFLHRLGSIPFGPIWMADGVNTPSFAPVQAEQQNNGMA